MVFINTAHYRRCFVTVSMYEWPLAIVARSAADDEKLLLAIHARRQRRGTGLVNVAAT